MDALPTEILCAIVRLVDPIGLISLSQSSRTLRTLIQPTQQNFVHRLLALELDPVLAGAVPFYGADNSISPPWTYTEAWNAIRFACLGCMKLLPHTRFSNQNILSIRRRKPAPDSREAADAKTRGLRIQARLQHEQEERAALLRALAEQNTGKEDVRLLEDLLEGTHRARRRCNECRFLCGDFSRHTRANVGTASVPILKSRQVEVTLALERYLPGLLPTLPRAKAPPLFRVYRAGSRTERFTLALYHVRCPGCAVWQEFAAFRVAENRVKTTPRSMVWWLRDRPSAPLPAQNDGTTTLQCNRCFAAAHGRARLGEALTAFVGSLLDAAQRQAEYHLRFGWRVLEGEMRESAEKLSPAFRALIEPWVDFDADCGSEQKTLQIDFARCEATELRRRVVCLRALAKTELGVNCNMFLSSWWFHKWMEGYEQIEERCEMLQGLRATLTAEALLEFVLDSEKDPYRVM
ncbi:hypothetical protein B0H19DRAFT_1252158 [Mycena capillaripes]|nr:hypothetical protein B0H19DRAFT_1252158 [Mycena capillaripes]